MYTVCFHSDIQDGCHWGHVEILQLTSLPNHVRLCRNIMGGIGAYRDLEMLESFRSDIQNGCHGGHLEILQTASPPKP